MSSSANHNSSGCEGVQELIAWYPSQVLDEDEKRRVESHIAGCPVCADLLRFTSDLKELLLEKQSPHPESDILVCFVEDKAAMDPQQRSVVEGHLAICLECREQAVILEAVERNSTVEDTITPSVSHERVIPPYSQEMTAGLGVRLRSFWDSLRAGLFKPVPAAVYLVVALIAIGLHLFRPAERMGVISDLETGYSSGVRPVPDILGGVVILPDETDRVRQLGSEETKIPRVDVNKPQFVLLELTSLEAPPRVEDIYTVELLNKDSGELVLTATVEGKAFIEHYTICVPLERGTLTPGNYDVNVKSPRGDTVFRSSLIAR